MTGVDRCGKNTVLVVTQDFDPTVDPVVRELASRGAQVVRFDLSDFPEEMSFISSDFSKSNEFLVRGISVDASQVVSIWYRRPTRPKFSSLGDVEAQFAQSETDMGLGGFLGNLQGLWVNRPANDRAANIKPDQLRVARDVGLATPRTLLTNRPESVRDVLAQGVRLIYKPLISGIITYPGGRPVGVMTTEVSGYEEYLEQVHFTPCLFQEYVPKLYEIRLTIIGDMCFPVTLDSQRDRGTQIDWRRAPVDDSLNGPAYGLYRPLPDSLLMAIRRLMLHYGLAYGAIDLILTPDGEYVFLEVNPGGQFMWMETELGLPMADAMARLLRAGTYATTGLYSQIGY